MKKLIFLLLIFPVSVIADEAATTFSSANELYREGKFADAAKLYEKLLDNGYKRADVYYNLGNAYYRMDKIPESILNYERALLLSPGDDDINYNLRIANLQTIDKFEAVPQLFFEEWYEYFLSRSDSSSWGIFTVIAFWLLAASVSFFIWLSPGPAKKICFATAIVVSVLVVFGFVFSYQSFIKENNKNTAIIFTESVYVKSAPGEESADQFILHEGTKVRITGRAGGWTEIKIKNGNVGWIPYSAIEAI